tara:strand:- start:836 stop:1075 length:240 start_codon:yes stop_codon:yes gene_type:complete
MELVLIFVLLTIAYIVYSNYANIFDSNEGWVDYTQEPYKYVKEGADPIHYYRRDRYRKPYRHGFKFNQSYPYHHKEPLP